MGEKHLLRKTTLHIGIMLFQTTTLITTNSYLLQLGFGGHRGLVTATAFVLINLLNVMRAVVNVQPIIIEFLN